MARTTRSWHARQARRARHTRHPMALYRLRALSHPAQAFLALAAAMLAVLTLSVLVPFLTLAVGEVVFLGAIPRSRFFQAVVDEQLDRAAREEALAKRMVLAARLGDEHRLELEQLELLALRIRERIGEEHGQDAFGLGRLLATYARLATAHRTSTEAFRPFEYASLLGQLAALEASRARAPGPTRSTIDRRLAVGRTRAEVWRRALQDRERIAHELATIGDIVRWMYEECAATTAVHARAELDEILSTWQHDGATLCEVTELCHGEDAVDASVFTLRDATIRVDVEEPPTAAAASH
jgi:hypothetical protein